MTRFDAACLAVLSFGIGGLVALAATPAPLAAPVSTETVTVTVSVTTPAPVVRDGFTVTQLPTLPDAIPAPVQSPPSTSDIPAPVIADCGEGQFRAVDGACWPDSYNTPEVVYEDDPRWDCKTMGNEVCGEQDSDGTWWLVSYESGVEVSRVLRGW